MFTNTNVMFRQKSFWRFPHIPFYYQYVLMLESRILVRDKRFITLHIP